jgi:hypothetical protein
MARLAAKQIAAPTPVVDFCIRDIACSPPRAVGTIARSSFPQSLIVAPLKNRNDAVPKSVLDIKRAGWLEAKDARPRSLPRNGILVPPGRRFSSSRQLATTCRSRDVAPQGPARDLTTSIPGRGARGCSGSGRARVSQPRRRQGHLASAKSRAARLLRYGCYAIETLLKSRGTALRGAEPRRRSIEA